MPASRTLDLFELAQAFTLPWSAYVRLLSVSDVHARRFYEIEALRGGSVRQLDRQIGSQFYERTALSKDKDAMLARAMRPKPGDIITPDDAIKDPYVLEFLDLKDEYSESDLEGALNQRLEDFLLELGEGFNFVGRQRRLRIDQTWHRVDLLFCHRRLRCIVIIDLKLGSLTHADVGQMPKCCKKSWKVRGACWSLARRFVQRLDNERQEWRSGAPPLHLVDAVHAAATPGQQVLLARHLRVLARDFLEQL